MAAATTRAERAARKGQASGARAGSRQKRDQSSPAPEPRFPLGPRVPEIAPLVATYPQLTLCDTDDDYSDPVAYARWRSALDADLLIAPRGAPEGAVYDAERAQHAVDFIERLVYFEGRWAGNRFRLTLWQERLIRYVFGWYVPSDDLGGHLVRLIRQVYLEVPRKNGKSTFAAAVALYLAYADDEPAPQVFFAAADKDQAKIAYHMAEVLVQQDAELLSRTKLYNSTNKMLLEDVHGELRALSSETKKLYGLNLHGLVFDELMAQPNRVLWDALTTAQGSRIQPLIFAITTAGWDRTSVAFEQREYTRQIAEGGLTDPTFLGVCYSVPEDADWTQPETWIAAAPSMGETVSLSYYEKKANEAMGQPSAQNSFRTLMLCQWVGQSQRIIPMDAWNTCRRLAVPKLTGQRCFGGLDLSQTTDMTALVLDFPLKDGRHAWKTTVWVPEDGLRDRGLRDRAPYEVWREQGWLHTTPGSIVDYAYVKDALREAAELYDLKDVSYDRWNASQLVDELEADGFEMVKVGQGLVSMSAPTKEMLRLVVSGKLLPDDNPVLTWMADNAGGETDAAENVKLSKTRSATRIDGLVAGVMALDGAMRRGRVRRSVYEDRGPDDIYEGKGDE